MIDRPALRLCARWLRSAASASTPRRVHHTALQAPEAALFPAEQPAQITK